MKSYFKIALIQFSTSLTVNQKLNIILKQKNREKDITELLHCNEQNLLKQNINNDIENGTRV